MLDAAGHRPIGQKEERGVGVRGGENRGAEDERMVSKQVWRKNHGGS